MNQPTSKPPLFKTLQEFRKGFQMGDRMLRPAMVQVSFTDAVVDTPAAETADDEEAAAAAEGEQQEQQQAQQQAGPQS
jgi:hypothetical protein